MNFKFRNFPTTHNFWLKGCTSKECWCLAIKLGARLKTFPVSAWVNLKAKQSIWEDLFDEKLPTEDKVVCIILRCDTHPSDTAPATRMFRSKLLKEFQFLLIPPNINFMQLCIVLDIIICFFVLERRKQNVPSGDCQQNSQSNPQLRTA